jgi:hypothetical protein
MNGISFISGSLNRVRRLRARKAQVGYQGGNKRGTQFPAMHKRLRMAGHLGLVGRKPARFQR